MIDFRIIILGAALLLSFIYSLFKVRAERDEPFTYKDYLKQHPDLCPFLTECQTYTDPKCHKKSHVDCPTYLEKEWK